MKLKRLISLAVTLGIFAACLATSYGLARAGEPQSAWLWCDLVRAC